MADMTIVYVVGGNTDGTMIASATADAIAAKDSIHRAKARLDAIGEDADVNTALGTTGTNGAALKAVMGTIDTALQALTGDLARLDKGVV